MYYCYYAYRQQLNFQSIYHIASKPIEKFRNMYVWFKMMLFPYFKHLCEKTSRLIHLTNFSEKCYICGFVPLACTLNIKQYVSFNFSVYIQLCQTFTTIDCLLFCTPIYHSREIKLRNHYETKSATFSSKSTFRLSRLRYSMQDLSYSSGGLET